MRSVVLVLLLSSCSLPPLPGDAAPIVKIGLIAPFEGLGRPLGYAVLPAVTLALNEANASGQLGPYRVALVALNDDNNPAPEGTQVATLAEDPAVLAVLGPWTADTAADAAGAYTRTGLPALLAAPAVPGSSGVRSLCPPPADIAAAMLSSASGLSWEVAGPDNTLAGDLRAAVRSAPDAGANASPLLFYSGDAEGAAAELLRRQAEGSALQLIGGPDVVQEWFAGRAGTAAEGVWAVICRPPIDIPGSFATAYRQRVGTVPGPHAELAYAGTRILLSALAADIREHGRPSRSGIATALSREPLSTGVSWITMLDGRWQPAR